MIKNWSNDDRITKYLRWNTHTKEEDSIFICDMWKKEAKEINNYQRAIVLKETNEVIESIGLVDLDDKIYSIIL